MSKFKLRALALLAALSCTLVAGAASAQPPPAPLKPSKQEQGTSDARPPSPREPGPTRWYGWQTLIADGSAVALAAGNYAWVGSDETSLLGVAAVLAYWGGGPVIHFGHHQSGRGGISLGLRLGLPLLGAVGGLMASRNCSFSQCDGLGWGAVAGIAGAMVIDAGFLAHEPIPSRPAHEDVGAGPTKVMPALVLAPNLMGFGFRGEL